MSWFSLIVLNFQLPVETFIVNRLTNLQNPVRVALICYYILQQWPCKWQIIWSIFSKACWRHQEVSSWLKMYLAPKAETEYFRYISGLSYPYEVITSLGSQKIHHLDGKWFFFSHWLGVYMNFFLSRYSGDFSSSKHMFILKTDWLILISD